MMSSASKTTKSSTLAQKRALLAARLQQAVNQPRQSPLSFAQQRLWFLDQLEPNSPMYNMPMAVRVRGPLKHGPLGQAINAIVARHDILRTRFISHEGEPVQEVMPAGPVKINVIDLRSVPEDHRGTEMMARLRETGREPFNISADVLIRVTLF